MTLFERCIPIILKHEGGSKYTDLKNDPGGPTKYGISLLFLKKLSLIEGDIDHDGDIDAEDIRAISESKSKELYYNYFWYPLHLQLINNDHLCLHLFDHGVNAGTKTAVKILQKMLGLTKDGIIGPKTSQKINEYTDPKELIINYANQRKNYYDQIIMINSHLMEFKKGWYNRVDTTHF